MGDEFACRFRKITCVCWVWCSSAFPGLIIWHLHDQLFQCSSTFLAGMNRVEVRMLYFYFFFRKLLFLNKFLPGRNPKQALPTSILILPPFAGSPPLPSAIYWSLFGLQLCHSSFKVFRAFREKGEQRTCCKHWKRGLEERNERTWVGVGKRDRTSTAEESEQTTYLFSLKR